MREMGMMMDERKEFFAARGKHAWAGGCPCCGEVVAEYQPETEVYYEFWVFGCGCEITMDHGSFDVTQGCPDAMQMHLEGVVIAAA
jgi:hypothetical protein